MKLKWNFRSPKDYDLCTKYNGKYCDVTNHYQGGWNARFNMVLISAPTETGRFKTRKEAAQAIEDFLGL